MVDGHWKRLATSSVLLAVIVLVAGGLLALIGSTVFPQAGMFVWAAVVLLVFLLFQLAMFRILGLRSRADESAAPTRSAPCAAAPASSTDEQDHAHPPPGARGDLVPPDSPNGPNGPNGAEGSDEAEKSADRDWRAWRG